MSERSGFSYTVNSCYEGVTMIVETRFSEANETRPPAYLTAIFTQHDDTNPDSDKYGIVQDLFYDWLDRTADDPNRIVYYEGRNTHSGFTAEDSIRRHFGESGLLKYLARRHRIPAKTLEPSWDEEFRAVRTIFRDGDGIAANGEQVVCAIVGARILPFLYTSQPMPAGIDSARYAFDLYLLTDGRESCDIGSGSFARVFEQYFDTPFVLDDFKDPNHPLVAKARAITEPHRYSELLDRNPKLRQLSEAAAYVQYGRSILTGKRLVQSYESGVSVFGGTGLPHGERLQSALGKLLTVYNPNIPHYPGERQGIAHSATNPYSKSSISLGALRTPILGDVCCAGIDQGTIE